MITGPSAPRGTASRGADEDSLLRESARLLEAYREARARAAVAEERSARLQRAAAALAGAASVEDVASAAAEQAIAACGARAAAVALPAEAGARRVVTRGARDEGLLRAMGASPRWSASAERGRGALVVLPLETPRGAEGALGLRFDEGADLDDGDQGFLAAVAGQCAAALERARLCDGERAAVAALAAAEVRGREVLADERRRVQEVVAEARAAARAKDEFLAMLGHELRNPLSPILTALYLMKLRGGDALQRERTVVERQVRHLVRLVDDLLDVSRITRGKVRLERRRVEVGDVVGKAVEMASPLLEERSHRLALDVAAPLAVDGDVHRLAQVFANLLTNAAKYTPPGGDVAVTARASGGRAVVRVRDSGIGIPPDLLPRVFDLFVQGERSADRQQGGLGLGLAIVRSLVAAHGGEVSAASDGPGRGSTFEVRLPLADGRALAPALTPPPRPASACAPARVLVVDDNREAAELLAETLRARGHEVAVAGDGPEGLEAAARLAPDVALLDIGLPVMDGWELARRLREQRPRVALVAITGYGQAVDRARSEAEGFAAHLVKPVPPEEVAVLVAELGQPRGGGLTSPPASNGKVRSP